MKLSYPIFLMGYMTSGKSSLGKKLAKQFEIDFIDLDRYIENQEGQSITELFQNKGESYFREKEAEALRRIVKGEKTVVALGGGTPCHHQNMDYITQTGMSIYLDIAASTLIGRLREKKSKRPLVAQLNDEEISRFVSQQLKERSPFYKQADLTISADSKPKLTDVVKAIQSSQNKKIK